MTHSGAPRMRLFYFHHILTSSAIFYETDIRQHEIHLLINYLRFYSVNSVEPLITDSHERTHSVKVHATHKSYGPALY